MALENSMDLEIHQREVVICDREGARLETFPHLLQEKLLNLHQLNHSRTHVISFLDKILVDV